MIVYWAFGVSRKDDEWAVVVRLSEDDGVSTQDLTLLFDTEEAARQFVKEVNNNMEGLVVEHE